MLLSVLLWLQVLVVDLATASFSYQQYLAGVLPPQRYVVDGDLPIGLINRFRKLPGRGVRGMCGEVDKDMQETLYSVKWVGRQR